MSAGVAILCGSARGMWEDLREAHRLCAEAGADVANCAVNAAGLFVPGLRQWFITQYANVLPFSQAREALRPDGAGYHLHVPGRAWFMAPIGDLTFWQIETKGTIALFGARVLVSLGYDRVILSGVPLDDKAGYFYGDPMEGFGMSDDVLDAWEDKSKDFNDSVRSMSGLTRDLLGAPSPAWISGGRTQ